MTTCRSDSDPMDTQDIRTLKILEAIDGQESPSQRDMAQSLNVSLGLVNSFVRRLAKKGYFKITHLPRNRIRYILTPKGAAEKSRLTYTYIQLSLRFYKDARQKFRRLLKELEYQGIAKIAFFGAGDMAEIGCLSIQETHLELVAIADPRRSGEDLFDMAIISPENLKQYEIERIIITSTDLTPQEATALLIRLAIPEESILVL
jgi:DNA-binding MarR family transcriptional regulator